VRACTQSFVTCAHVIGRQAWCAYVGYNRFSRTALGRSCRAQGHKTSLQRLTRAYGRLQLLMTSKALSAATTSWCSSPRKQPWRRVRQHRAGSARPPARADRVADACAIKAGAGGPSHLLAPWVLRMQECHRCYTCPLSVHLSLGNRVYRAPPALACAEPHYADWPVRPGPRLCRVLGLPPRHGRCGTPSTDSTLATAFRACQTSVYSTLFRVEALYAACCHSQPILPARACFRTAAACAGMHGGYGARADVPSWCAREMQPMGLRS